MRFPLVGPVALLLSNAQKWKNRGQRGLKQAIFACLTVTRYDNLDIGVYVSNNATGPKRGTLTGTPDSDSEPRNKIRKPATEPHALPLRMAMQEGRPTELTYAAENVMSRSGVA